MEKVCRQTCLYFEFLPHIQSLKDSIVRKNLMLHSIDIFKGTGDRVLIMFWCHCGGLLLKYRQYNTFYWLSLRAVLSHSSFSHPIEMSLKFINLQLPAILCGE